MPYKDPEKEKEYNRIWSKNYYNIHKDDEHFKEKRKEWGKNTRQRLDADVERKEKFLQKRREWCKSPKGLESSRKWREKNKEKLKLYMRNWQNNHRQQCRDAVKRWEQKHFPEYKLKFTSLLGNKCQKCGITVTIFNLSIFDFHHINGKGQYEHAWKKQPEKFEEKIRGGEIALLCANCHRLKHHLK